MLLPSWGWGSHHSQPGDIHSVETEMMVPLRMWNFRDSLIIPQYTRDPGNPCSAQCHPPKHTVSKEGHHHHKHSFSGCSDVSIRRHGCSETLHGRHVPWPFLSAYGPHPFTGPHLSQESKVTRKERPALILPGGGQGSITTLLILLGMLRFYQPFVFMKWA